MKLLIWIISHLTDNFFFGHFKNETMERFQSWLAKNCLESGKRGIGSYWYTLYTYDKNGNGAFVTVDLIFDKYGNKGKIKLDRSDTEETTQVMANILRKDGLEGWGYIQQKTVRI